MSRGGYRPGSGPRKGAKYRPRTKKADETAKQKRSIAAKPPGVPADIAAEAAAENLDPLAFMVKTMNDPKVDIDIRTRLAIAAAPFVHRRAGDSGKKEQQGEKAKAASSGKFAPSKPPLTIVK